MSKTRRTLTMDSDISRALSQICVRHGDATWHVEQALAGYKPLKALLAKGDKPDKPKTKRFERPNFDQLADAFFMGKSMSLNEAEDAANKFLNYYDSNGWKVGKNPMKDWQATVRNWLSKRKSDENGNRNRKQHDKNRSATERVRDAIEAESIRVGDVSAPLGNTDGDLFQQVSERRPSDEGMGATIEGTYTRTN